MPISPAAIDRYLRHRLPQAPPVKDLPPTDLERIIRRYTGKEYAPLTEPRPHQLAGQAFLAAQGSGLLFFGMRSGKTKLILDRFMHLRRIGAARKALIVVPNPVIRPVWVNESKLHTPETIVRTVANDPLEFIDAGEDPNCHAVVCSWSSLQNIFCVKQPPKKGSKDKRNKLVPDYETIGIAAEFFDFGAIDEIHGAKDHESLRFSICAELMKYTRTRIGCTGTPFGRDPFAMWSQAFLVDRGACLGHSYYFFKQAFGKQEYNHFSRSQTSTVYDREKDDLLAQKMQPLSLSYTMQECGIGKVTPTVIKLDMTDEQRAHYRKAAEEFVESPSGGERRKNAFHKLRMISSGYVPFTDDMGSDRIAVLPRTPKLDWLEDLIEQASGARCIVFHDYIQTGRIICEMLKRRKVRFGQLRGATTDKGAEVIKFQQGKVDWLVINNQTGNAGIDLRGADYQLFYESPTSPIIRQQAEARALGDRGGRGLYIDDLICSKIEERILKFHAEGADLLQSLVFRDEDIFE